MKFDLIKCTVRLNLDGNVNNMEVVKSGPDAITPPEAVILMARHNLGDADEDVCFFHVEKVGEVERKKKDEAERLALKYGADVAKVFPRGAHMPTTLEDLELPADRMAPVKEKPAEDVSDDATDDQSDDQVSDDKPKTAAERKKALRVQLIELNVDIPKGNLSEADLEALLAEAGGA